MARREMGKITFLDLVDRSGRIQLLAGKVDVDLGDIVGVTGHPAKSRRGEPSLQVAELELLGKIRSPLPDTFHGLTDIEARYRKRYLDLLMNEETRSTSSSAAGSSRRSAASSTRTASSRSRRRCCSHATAAPSRGRS